MCLEGFPTFNGVTHELRSWISWLEDFFVWENFTDDEKMNLAQSLIEGEAEAWFYRRQKMILFRSWEHLRDCLVLRFGDRKDLELIRLLAKQDQFLKERRDESKIRRMKNTSVDPQEATPSMATIQETIPVEKLHNSLEITDKSLNQVDEISVEKGSKNDATLLSPQLLVSDSENLRNNELMAINSVVENLETVVIKTKIQKSSKMDVVNGDVGRIQQVKEGNKQQHNLFRQMGTITILWWWLQNGSKVQWHILIVKRVSEIFGELKRVQASNGIIYVLSYGNHHYKLSWHFKPSIGSFCILLRLNYMKRLSQELNTSNIISKTILHIYEKPKLGDFSQSYLLVAATLWSTKMQRGIESYHVWHRWKARYLQIFEYKFDAGSNPNCELATLVQNRGLKLSHVHELQRRGHHILQELSEACSSSMRYTQYLRDNVSLG
ncbi:hypothetical protein [Arabidopsis thaliana]|uniref:Uncharacterized protein T32N15.12 n=1 Tax=Arabidopsis thaliana TaxID=3702 RepID=O22242_ARATH|nr:hypothetical protein [Arabidopsis thaliana]